MYSTNKENILVSVIIPTYGRNESLKRAISSIYKQTYKGQIELIVIDDNKPDSKFRKENLNLIKEFDNIRYIQHEKNMGGCAARNTGIKNAKGKYIGFLDDDDVWHEDFISEHLLKFHTNKEAHLIYCNFYINRNNNTQKVIMNNRSGEVFTDLLNGWCPASTSLFLIKRECFEQYGYFDESLKSFQDYDLWLNFSRYFVFDYCDKYLVTKYEHSEDQVSLNPVTRQLGLDILSLKWNCILSKKEKEVFNDTLKEKQKQIYYLELINYRNSLNYVSFFTSTKKYLDFSNNAFKDFLKVSFILLFGYRKLIFIKRYLMDRI